MKQTKKAKAYLVNAINYAKEKNKLTRDSLCEKARIGKSTLNKMLAKNTDSFPENETINRVASALNVHPKALYLQFKSPCSVVSVEEKVNNLLDAAILFDISAKCCDESAPFYKILSSNLETYKLNLGQCTNYLEMEKYKSETLAFLKADRYIVYRGKVKSEFDFFKSQLTQMYYKYDNKPLTDPKIIKRAIAGYQKFQETLGAIAVDFFTDDEYKRVFSEISNDKDILVNEKIKELGKVIDESHKIVNEVCDKTEFLINKSRDDGNPKTFSEIVIDAYDIIRKSKENFDKADDKIRTLKRLDEMFDEIIEDEFLVKYALVCFAVNTNYVKDIPNNIENNFDSRWECQSDLFLCVKGLKLYFENMIAEGETKECIF